MSNWEEDKSDGKCASRSYLEVWLWAKLLIWILGEKTSFSKIRIVTLMFKFLASTENARKSNEKIRWISAGKLLEKHESKMSIRNFTIIIQHE